MIKEIEAPRNGWKVTRLGGPVAALVKAVNALRKLQIKPSTRWHFSWDEGGAVLEIVPTAATYALILHPFQPYLSPYTGSGTAPANQGRRIRIRPGYVTDALGDMFPARRNIEILVPANCTDGYYVWLVANLDGDGNMTALDYDHGATPPPRASVGDFSGLPSVVYRPLFFVTSNATHVNDLSNIFEKTVLNLFPVLSGYDISTQTVSRSMQWTVGGTE